MFVIHLGKSGFPLGTAQIQRIRLTFKSLKFAGVNPLIINKESVYKTIGCGKINKFQGIPYIYTSVSTNRPDSFFYRSLNKITGYIGELYLLLKKRKSIQAAIYYDSSFGELIYYRLLSKILHFKIILQYVEFRSSIIKGQKRTRQINNILFDKYCFFFCDGIIVISEFLRNRTLAKKPTLPLIKIPAICDFEEFTMFPELKTESFIMYCGTLVYLEVILFVLDVFCKLKQAGIYQGDLLFVVGGDAGDDGFAYIKDKISHSGYDGNIKLEINLPHHDLIAHYIRAELLIVPLRNTLQDIAGFHHKIGEYCASGKPIISTNLGELKFYFKDGFSAILAEEYSVESYFQKLFGILNSREQLDNIAREGYKVGAEKLNYLKYSNELKQFIDQL